MASMRNSVTTRVNIGEDEPLALGHWPLAKPRKFSRESAQMNANQKRWKRETRIAQGVTGILLEPWDSSKNRSLPCCRSGRAVPAFGTKCVVAVYIRRTGRF